MQHHFSFISTTQDLLDAHSAFVTFSTGVRPVFRPFLIGLCLLWTVGPIVSLVSGEGLEWWKLLIWLSGGLLAWNSVIRPYLQKRKIRLENAAEQPITLDFLNERIHIGVAGIGDFARNWGEVTFIKPCKKGMLLGLSDGSINWIPIRAFRDKQDLDAFAVEIQTRLQEQAHR